MHPNNDIDKERFAQACATVVDRARADSGIGTLGEKTLHAVLKHYIEPDPSRHEQKRGSYVVDVYTGEHVFEIQTRQFDKLRTKLAKLLADVPVTVVYPVPARKWLLWIDPRTGEISRRRLSPRRGRFTDIFPELYRIKPLLSHPNLSFLILRIDMEEYRLLNGWSQDRKKGSSRDERLPLELIEERWLRSPEDYLQLLPCGLPDPFTSADLARLAPMSRKLAQTVLNVLLSLRVVEAAGKRSRYRLYGIPARCGRMALSRALASQSCPEHMKG